MIRSMFILSILIFTHMTGVTVSQETTQPAKAPEAGKNVSPESAADLVVARVSGVPITEKDVLVTINEIARRENMTLEQSQQRNSMLFDRAVDNLINISLLRTRTREMNITISDAEVNAQLQQAAQRFSTPEAFKKALADQGVTEADLRKNISESMLVQKVVEEASRGAAPVTEAVIEKFYADNPERFALPERVRMAHILLQIPPNATAAQKEEIRKKLEGIRVEIAAEIITFAEAAEKYSQDANTAEKGGEMGVVSRDNLPKPFADAVFKAKPGMVSVPLESQSGYHVLKVLDLMPAGQAALEDVKNTLRQALEQNAQQSARQKFIEELRSKASIEYFMTSEEFAKRRK